MAECGKANAAKETKVFTSEAWGEKHGALKRNCRPVRANQLPNRMRGEVKGT